MDLTTCRKMRFGWLAGRDPLHSDVPRSKRRAWRPKISPLCRQFFPWLVHSSVEPCVYVVCCQSIQLGLQYPNCIFFQSFCLFVFFGFFSFSKGGLMWGWSAPHLSRAAFRIQPNCPLQLAFQLCRDTAVEAPLPSSTSPAAVPKHVFSIL